MKKYIYIFIIIACAGLLAVFDQYTKLLAIEYLMNKQPIVLIDGVFELSFVKNSGAAFGILNENPIFLLIITIAALSALMVALLLGKLDKQSKMVKIACTLILAGGIGNLIDRIFRGKVVDFFYFKLIDFPVFNMADSYVSIGACLLLIFYLFIYKEDKHPVKNLSEREGDATGGIENADTSSGEDGR
ncbi:MAG: signal peptidase II [Oscillospiraceae bacterium]|nr:signal peptidase II [Oscillospiraceae bacterium]MDD4412926.1 signal peptidase II [Oscillospiraceae bacterium]